MRTRGRSKFLLFAASVGWLSCAAFLSPQQKAPQKPIVFGRDILPILSDKCFKCHGPDTKSRLANMRLDVPEGAFENRGGRFPIVPGKPQDSLVVKRIQQADNPMPPVFSGKSLTEAEKELLTRWISEGAKYGKLWSFEPIPRKVQPPKLESSWPQNNIDRFILDRLNREGMQPSAPASKERILRRVTLDLTGLPPTAAEIEAFEKDTSPDAYVKVVDRLLANPHFGERIAIDWLDAARYSDSYGYQSDLLMPTWPYRDWVVKAFNANMPYDRFLTEQLAGDLLPNATQDDRLATAYNRLHRQSNEGGSIALEFKTEYAVDRVSTFGTSMLGLTLGCARCHDHKFDPISQREFYQLFAYFNSIDEYGLLLSTEIVPTPSLLLPTQDQAAKLKELKAAYAFAASNLKTVETDSTPRFESWLGKQPPEMGIPSVLARFSFDTDEEDKFKNEAGGAPTGAKIGSPSLVPDRKGGKALQLDGDNGLVVRGLPAKERWEPFTWSFWISDPRSPSPVVLLHRTGGTDVGFCGLDLTLEDGYLTARVMRAWPGNAVAVKSKVQVRKDGWDNVAWSWDGSGLASGLRLYVNGKPAPLEVLNDKLWKKIDAYGDLGPSGGEWSFGQRFRDAGFKGGKLDDVTFANRVLSPLEVAQLCDGKSLSSAAGKDALKAYFLAAIDEQAAKARSEAEKAQVALVNFEEGIYEVPVMEEAKQEIPAYVLARGQYDAPRTEATRVVRGTPQVLPTMASRAPKNRLGLAQWLVDPNHPLTARVAVNRLWQMVFGVGLVETTENFGVQGSQPSHPELLDYLARHFIDSKWDVKGLLREMVLSATYRQDSARSKASAQKDPTNRLYGRGPSVRLSAEMVRDTVLAAAGLLNAKVGGPPVNPYQPAGIWQENNTMSPGFVQSKGADLYRRSLYSTWKRTTPVPSMLMFDATAREACVVRRPSTNTPLQALVLLNDVQFVEAARSLAERVLKGPGPDAKRISSAFVLLAGRMPDKREQAVLEQTLVEQKKQFAEDRSSAAKLISVGDSKADPGLKPEDLAAMTVAVQTVMNSDAVIWKR